MNGIEKLKQLTNVYRAALKDYGHDFIIRESELIGDPLFMEWVASKRTNKVNINDFWEAEGKFY